MENAENNEIDWTFGYKLKKLRTSKSLTLKDVASKLGVTPSFLSMVENGKSGISLTTMQRLLRVYGVTLAEFTHETDDTSRVIPLEKGRKLNFNSDKIEAYLLKNDSVKDCIELIYFRLKPKTEIGFFQHDGVEFIHILEGELNVTLVNPEPQGEVEENYTLQKGDTMHHESIWLHKCVNHSQKPCVFLAAVYPSTF
ncbi:MAG: helix-turn-helix domain-containing protein [Synergistaceae bacterium]|nr:helix-turn-helix domain-containing protein [Synergistaceae bacterium]